MFYEIIERRFQILGLNIYFFLLSFPEKEICEQPQWLNFESRVWKSLRGKLASSLDGPRFMKLRANQVKPHGVPQPHKLLKWKINLNVGHGNRWSWGR
jgi:hypothetical protein